MSDRETITIPVRLDVASLSLTDDPGPETISQLDVVEWVFEPTELTGQWVPMIYFDIVKDEQGSSYCGPFEDLTQTIQEDPGEPKLVVKGRVRYPSPGGFPYYAGLCKGVAEKNEPGEHRQLVSFRSSRQILKVSPPAPMGREERARAADSRQEPTYELPVTMAGDGKSLWVPLSPVPLLREDTEVLWNFKEAVASASGKVPGNTYPLIVFYRFRPKEDNGQPPNVCFGPFKKLVYKPTAVIGYGCGVCRGTYHYEAAVLTSRRLSLTFVSSGDPQVDDEGDPDPDSEPS